MKYTKMNGEKCHLLGLRDFTDVKPLSPHATDAPLFYGPPEPNDGSSEVISRLLGVMLRSFVASLVTFVVRMLWLFVAMPGDPSSVLAPSSKARRP